MDFRIEIAGPAITDLANIVSFIAQDDPEVARAFGNNLLDAAMSLGKAPFKGSPYPSLPHVRKLTLPPFKIFYRVNETTKKIEILRFWHAARREPEL